MEKVTWLFILWVALVLGAYLILKLTYNGSSPTPTPNSNATNHMSPQFLGGLWN